MEKVELKKQFVYITKKELYQLGWDSNKDSISDIFEDKIVQLLFIRDYHYDKAKRYDKGYNIYYYVENVIDNYNLDLSTPEEIICPDCKGHGEFEVSAGSHSIFQKCETCNGIGTVSYN